MSKQIFISYRRSDSSSEAGRLQSTISQSLTALQPFQDVSSIKAGDQWPQKLKDALRDAEIVVVLIGPDWIRASDEYGIRRIDMANDWVRQEIAFAIQTNKKLLPVLVRGAKMPPEDKLPESISALCQKQAVEIRDAYWDHDIKLVLEQLKVAVEPASHLSVGAHNREDHLGVYPVPPPEVPDPISDEKIEIALNGSLSHWKKVISPLPEDQSKIRVELFRIYRFETFAKAIDFMYQVAPGCDIALHHPRWENVWRSVKVYLSTWDIGHKISDRDIQLAKYLDQAFLEFPGARHKK